MSIKFVHLNKREDLNEIPPKAFFIYLYLPVKNAKKILCKVKFCEWA